MADNKEKPKVTPQGIAGLIVILFIVAPIAWCSMTYKPPTAEEREAMHCKEGSSAAWVRSREAVRDRLQYPAEAEFPHPYTVLDLGDCRLSVFAKVDAPNAFGAKRRVDYNAVMVYDPRTDSWSVEHVEIMDP